MTREQTQSMCDVRYVQCRYYMNGEDAYRLKLLLPLPSAPGMQAGIEGEPGLQTSEMMEPERSKTKQPEHVTHHAEHDSRQSDSLPSRQ